MTIKRKVLMLLSKLEDLIFTNHSCISCGLEIEDGSMFSMCDECLRKLEIISGKVCEKCGEEMKGLVCEVCKDKNYTFSKNISIFYYNEITSKIVKKLKYSRKKYYAKYIAEMMTVVKDNFKDIDYLTFVPSGKKSLKERGYNQSEEIAKEIGKIIGLPVLKLLGKKDGFKNQAGMNRLDRLKNLEDAFYVLENSKKLNGKIVMLIDDVFTTGTTLTRCSSELAKLKPKKIITMTFAKTKFESNID